jgi:glycosyltransferase involved in cell wall biosynthesis
MKVLLINWDGYPTTAQGGVYAWEKAIIDGITDFEFTVLNILSNPTANGQFKVPSHVKKIINMPLFGTNRYQEFYGENLSLLSKILRTTEKTITDQFLPSFKEFLMTTLSGINDPVSVSRSVFNIHKLLVNHDVKKCFEHPKTWNTFLDLLLQDPLYRNITVREAAVMFQVLQRNFQAIAIKIPYCDLVHCSLAWLPSLVALCAKEQYGCPVLVTEHGVAFRELVLYYNTLLPEESGSILWKTFSSNIIRAIFHMADRIAPVCYFNSLWEKMLLEDNSKIKVIYNGVDLSRFRPLDIKRPYSGRTVVYIGRLTLPKGAIKVIQAIKHVKDIIPDVTCLMYGESAELDYSRKCMQEVNKLDLEDNIKFMGATTEPEKAYNMADVVVNFAFTEAFPFSIIEAMACGKPIVATDVGGVGEALAGCGIVLKSSSTPREFGNTVAKLLSKETLRDEMGVAALKKATSEFSREKMIAEYKQEYWRLINKSQIVEEQLVDADNYKSALKERSLRGKVIV